MIKILLVALLLFSAVFYTRQFKGNDNTAEEVKNITSVFAPKPKPEVKPAIQLQTPPSSKTLNNSYHVFQSFNNCGPASLSMALSYFGISQSQQVIGNAIRPYQNPQGDNDDKSSTLYELEDYAKKQGLIAYYRPNGNIDLIKQLITYDIPVITRTWLKVNDDVGHYRVVKGYDSTSILQDDSYDGKNLWYSNSEFNAIWGKFNNEYLVIAPQDKKEIVEAILGENVDVKKAWQTAVKNLQQHLSTSPNDVSARFNLSVALYNIGDFRGSVEEFEKIENQLNFRALWYQIEPIQAYYELGNYDRVFALTDKVLNNGNRAFSELYLIRGNIYLKQGNTSAARQEFEKAVLYNSSMEEAQEALDSLQ